MSDVLLSSDYMLKSLYWRGGKERTGRKEGEGGKEEGREGERRVGKREGGWKGQWRMNKCKYKYAPHTVCMHLLVTMVTSHGISAAEISWYRLGATSANTIICTPDLQV